MRNKSMKYLLYFLCLCSSFLTLHSCDDNDDLKNDIKEMQQRVTELESAMDQLTTSITSLHTLQSNLKIVGITPTSEGYNVEMSDGTSFNLTSAKEIDGLLPILGINSEGFWTISYDQGKTTEVLKDKTGKSLSAKSDVKGSTPTMRISKDGFWQVSFDESKSFDYLLDEGNKIVAFTSSSYTSLFNEVTYDAQKELLSLTLIKDNTKHEFPVISNFYLRIKTNENGAVFTPNSTQTFEIEQQNVKEALIQAPENWLVELTEHTLIVKAPKKAVNNEWETVKIVITSDKNYIRIVSLNVKTVNSRYENACKTWTEFEQDEKNNVLLDYSYAGYMHGEVTPPDTYSLGYTVYDITDYGAVANDGQSDREALIKVLEAMGATRGKDEGVIRYQMGKPAKAIIYFPEGEFILQGEGENNEPFRLTMSDFIIKGAGRDKTTIKMDVQNEPARPNEMWSAPVMLEIKHNSGLSKLTDISKDASKGSFKIEVASTIGIQAGDWICLKLKNTSFDLIKQELLPWAPNSRMENMIKQGVQIEDYHQVISVGTSSITLKEPLMHAVEAKWNWEVMKFPHYENIGVEDITFEGKAKSDFAHHASAADDGAYKIIDFVRLTNSWMRRVDFVSVSEASSITSCANVSVYDVNIRGNRGHSAIRSQASSRVFIGKVTDESDGYLAITSSGQIGSTLTKGAGQYHACGVSKQNIGAVIWNVTWGSDGCFESHATQPRATLIDQCKGAFIPWRQGGDDKQMPNHLDDLVIWNMDATNVGYDARWNNKFIWWDVNSIWWKNMPPVIVGFHGANIEFEEPEKQIKRLESLGTKVEPASLYEAQLIKRLGYVPSWLNELK